MDNYINYDICIDEKVKLAQDLIEKLQKDFININGARKAKRNLEKEKNFIQNVSLNLILTLLSN